MKSKIIICLCLLFHLKGTAESKNTYLLDFTVSPGTVHVSATLLIKADTLFMHPACNNYDYPDGWSSFVKNLQIKNQSGRTVTYRMIGKSQWVLDETEGLTQLSLNYDIDLVYAKIKWDVGNEQSGLYDGQSLYSVTKPFFIVNTNDIPSSVQFKLPQNWLISTSWEKTNPGLFNVKNNDDLIGNSFFAGMHYQFTVKSNGFSFITALHNNMDRSEFILVNDALQKILISYMQIFPAGNNDNYLINIFHADEDDGESFNNSIAFTEKDKITGTNKLNWANNLGHELFHYWNGKKIVVGSSTERWFQEGFTEYYANLSLVRNKIITINEFYEKAQFMMGLYTFFKWGHAKFPLDSAGTKRGAEYRFGVYNGGWTIAMCWDMMIRSNSHGQKCLDDFMKLMYQKYANQPNAVTVDQLIETLNETAPGNYHTFYNDYISGAKVIPVNDYLKIVGLKGNYVDYQGEFYLTELPDKDAALIRKNWLK